MKNENERILASIVIPSARKDCVYRTISSLALQTLDLKHYEIILVTPEFDDFNIYPLIPLKVVPTKKVFPPGKMRNIGAGESRGEFLFFIDDDCLPPVKWMEKALEVFYYEEAIGAVGCRVVSANPGFWHRCADYALFGTYQHSRFSYRDIGSAALVIRRKAFEGSGGFNEVLFASEDWDFNFRLQRNGWKCAFNPDVEVLHDHRRGSIQGILKQAYRSGFYSSLAVQRAHFERLSFLAKISVKMGSPWRYWLLIPFYAFAVSFLQMIEQRDSVMKFLLFIPMIFIAKCCFQFGVWHSLVRDPAP